MDTHSPNADDLNDLERRLSNWRPSPTGLDADRMLFAAGRASARASGGRFVWPLLSGCLALVTVVLGVRLAAERTERLALAERLQQQTPMPTPAADPGPTPVEPSTTEAMPAEGYLAIRRRWEHDPNTLLAMAVPKGESSDGPLPANPPIPRVWQRDGLAHRS
jgi:hypothetical protein